MAEKLQTFQGPERRTRFSDWISTAQAEDPTFRIRGFLTEPDIAEKPASLTVIFEAEMVVGEVDTG